MQEEEDLEDEELPPDAEEEEGAAALAALLVEAHRQERDLARRLLARERDTLAGVRAALRAGSDRLALDVATDGGQMMTEEAQARRARAKVVAAVPFVQ